MNKLFVAVALCLSLFAVHANAQCSMCENMIQIIESWAEANTTITAIEGRLDLLCALVPAFEGPCAGVVDFDVTGLVGYLEKNGDANAVCKKMGVCAGLKLQGTRNQLENGYCNYCEYFFGMLESYVASGADQAEISNYLTFLCAMFPSETICQFGIANLAPYLMTYLTGVADPSTICYDVGACEYPSQDEWDEYSDSHSAQEASSMKNQEDEDEEPQHYSQDPQEFSEESSSRSHSSKSVDSNWDDDGDWQKRLVVRQQLHAQDTCSYCSLIVGWLANYIESDSGISELNEVLDTYVCSVSENLSGICSTLLSEMEMVVQFVAAQESPQNVCYELSLCEEGDELLSSLRAAIAKN